MNSAFITSYERDTETDLDFAQARYFNYGFGRFSSPDDFTKDSDINDPRSWNKYVYSRNNPLKYVDPTGEKATVEIETDEKNKTGKIFIKASIVYYAEAGISKQQLDQAASDASQNIANGWSGTFVGKDGITYTVHTTITYVAANSKEAAEKYADKNGFQNVIGFVNGEADPGKANSQVNAGKYDIFSDNPDTGRWNIQTVNNGDPVHEFGHLLGVGDRETGYQLMNTNIHLDPAISRRATTTDYQWAFGGATSLHRDESRPNTGPYGSKGGEARDYKSSTVLRAARAWWN